MSPRHALVGDAIDDELSSACDTSCHAPSAKLERRHSREFLSPAPHSRERQSTLHGAIFSLSATVLGGGILSLPFVQ
jgi:hypothetical protein